MRILFFLLLAVNLCFFLGSWGEYRVRTGQQVGAYSSELKVLHTLSERAAGLSAKQFVPANDGPQVSVAKMEVGVGRAVVAQPLVVSAYASENVSSPFVRNADQGAAQDIGRAAAEDSAVGFNPTIAGAIVETVVPESELEALVASGVASGVVAAPVAELRRDPLGVSVEPENMGDVLAATTITEVESLGVSVDPSLTLEPASVEVVSEIEPTDAVVLESGGCMLVGPFAVVDSALSVARTLESFGYVVNYHRTEQSASVGRGYSVLLPSAASEAGAQKNIAALRAAGVTDHYLIKEGVNKNAVMLGFYREQQFADERVQQLAAAGFAPRVDTRSDEAEAFWLEYEVLPGESRLPQGVSGLGGAVAKLQACS